MITHIDYAVENLAELLFAQSCAARGVQGNWHGRRTNRAYYRRLARAQLKRSPP